MVGGALEAVSLVTGLRALSLLALALYGCAWIANFSRARPAAARSPLA